MSLSFIQSPFKRLFVLADRQFSDATRKSVCWLGILVANFDDWCTNVGARIVLQNRHTTFVKSPQHSSSSLWGMEMVVVPGRRVAVVGAIPAPKYLRPHDCHTVRRVWTIHEDKIQKTKNQNQWVYRTHSGSETSLNTVVHEHVKVCIWTSVWTFFEISQRVVLTWGALLSMYCTLPQKGTEMTQQLLCKQKYLFKPHLYNNEQSWQT